LSIAQRPKGSEPIFDRSVCKRENESSIAREFRKVMSPMAENGFVAAGVIIFTAAAIRIGANSVRFVFCRQPKQADSWRI